MSACMRSLLDGLWCWWHCGRLSEVLGYRTHASECPIDLARWLRTWMRSGPCALCLRNVEHTRGEHNGDAYRTEEQLASAREAMR